MSSTELDSIPAMDPPQGVAPDLVNAPTFAWPVVAGLAVMSGLATLAFGARMFTRFYVMRRMQLEDYLLLSGWAFSITFNGFIFAQIPYGMGSNQYNVSLAHFQTFSQFVNLSKIFYFVCMLFIKLAILQQLKSIFMGTHRDWIYWLSTALMILITTFHLAIAGIFIAQCIPREKIWNPQAPGTCIDTRAATVVSGVFNIILDVLILLLPIYAISRLKIALKRKLDICAVFTIGLLACISSILRLYYSIVLLNTSDMTYNMINLCWTSALEVAGGLLVASFPVLPRLYRFLRGEQAAASTAGWSKRPTFNSSSQSRATKKSKSGTDRSDTTVAYSAGGDETRLEREWLPLVDGKENVTVGLDARNQETPH